MEESCFVQGGAPFTAHVVGLRVELLLEKQTKDKTNLWLFV